MGTSVHVPGGGDVTGVQELAEEYFQASQYPHSVPESLSVSCPTVHRATWRSPSRSADPHAHQEYGDKARQLALSRKGAAHELPFWENVRRAKEQGLDLMTDESREKHTDHLKDLTKFAVQEGHLGSDPFAGYKLPLGRKKSSAEKAKRHPFTGDELTKVLEAAVRDYHPISIDRRAPLLATYLGARREEIGQLLINDVMQVDGEWVISVTDEADDQKVKNRDSLRTLPLHLLYTLR